MFTEWISRKLCWLLCKQKLFLWWAGCLVVNWAGRKEDVNDTSKSKLHLLDVSHCVLKDALLATSLNTPFPWVEKQRLPRLAFPELPRLEFLFSAFGCHTLLFFVLSAPYEWNRDKVRTSKLVRSSGPAPSWISFYTSFLTVTMLLSHMSTGHY